MKPTSPRVLVFIATLAAVVGWVGARIWQASGGSPLPVPVAAMMLLVAIAVIVLVAAWPVRQWSAGVRHRAYDPLRAARAAVLAKASSHSGALLVGWYLGQALLLLPDLAIQSRSEAAIRFLIGAAAALAAVIAGLVAERWCRLKDDDTGKEAAAPDEDGGAVPA